MSTADNDAYFAGLDPVSRATMEDVRRSILAVVPEATQGISYGMPAFTVDGKVVAGLAAFSRHLSYLPHSGRTLETMGAALEGYERTKSSLHFANDTPLPPDLVRRLVETRMDELRA